MQRESFFLSLIRSLLSAFLATVGVLVGLFLILGVLFSYAPTHESADDSVSMEIMPNAKGSSSVVGESAPVILRVDIEGIIGDMNLNGGLVESFLRAAKRDFKEGRIKGILVNINSPGGTVVDSHIIYTALMDYKKEFGVPIYAYSPGLCASGGYYIACAAEKINTSLVSIVGSVGTKFGPLFNFGDFMEKHGINSITLTDGKYKEKYPTFSKLPADKSKNYQDILEITKQSYVQFTDLVTKARSDRGLTREDLIDRYGAQVFLGPTAEKFGYVDNGNSSYKDTLLQLLEASKVDPSQPYQVVRFSKKKSTLQDLVTGHIDLLTDSLHQSLFGLPRLAKWNDKLLYHFDAGSEY